MQTFNVAGEIMYKNQWANPKMAEPTLNFVLLNKSLCKIFLALYK